MNSKPHQNRSGAEEAGFTLQELLVVLVFIGLLGAIALPGLAATKPASRIAQCLENQRRMVLAWRLYSNDFSDKLPINGEASDVALSMSDPRITNGTWVHGMMGNVYGATPVSNIDPDLVRAGSLFPYVKDLKFYKCPEDKKTAPFSGAEVPTTRSISMNGWLNPTSPFGSTSRVFRTQSGITNPAPADLFVFIDENPGTINDGFFVCDQVFSPTIWIDLPAAYHAGGSGMSFADGHSIVKYWTDPKVLSQPSNTIFTAAHQNPPTDLLWLQQRSTHFP